MTGGGEVAAREGTLTFFVGGEASAFERCQPAFKAMARMCFTWARSAPGPPPRS